MKIENTRDLKKDGKLKLVIYGVSGSGKTSLVKTLPIDKTLVISAESGLRALDDLQVDYIDITVDDNKNILTEPADRLKRLVEIEKLLKTDEFKKKYDYIVVDSLTEISEVIALHWKKQITDKAKTFEIWGNIGQSQVSFITAMRDNQFYNVVFLCLEELDKDESSRRFYGPELAGTMAKQFLVAAFDEVFRLVVEADGRRYLQTQPLSTVKAKDRSGKLLPQEAPDLNNILNKIKKVEDKKEEVKVEIKKVEEVKK